MLRLTPKAKRNLLRILPFPVIWVASGTVFTLIEYAATGSWDPNPDAAIAMDASIVVFASLTMAIIGLLVGAIELVFLENLFRNRSFFAKIIYKLALYTVLMLGVVALLYPIAAAIELGVSITEATVWAKFINFLGSTVFYSTLLQIGASLTLCLLYAGVSEHLGWDVVSNFFSGRYHQPREENRIFMFLDMKSSTTWAERLGHKQYFLLLRSFYDDLADAIIKYEGEVYQYIGDEIVISWKEEDGIRNENCIRSFFAMKDALSQRLQFYQNQYGELPDFKAGVHFGQVTAGQMGALKKEIAFTGDVLNVAARIQSLCRQLNADLLVSKPLMDKLDDPNDFTIEDLGAVELKGRMQTIGVVSVSKVLDK